MIIFRNNLNDFSKIEDVLLRYNRTKIGWKMPSELEGFIFPYFFCGKSNLGLSWRHLRGILGHLGKKIWPPWASKTSPRWLRISQNRPEELPQRRLDGVRCAKTAPRCLKMPPGRPKRAPRQAKRVPREPKTPPGCRKSFQNKGKDISATWPS